MVEFAPKILLNRKVSAIANIPVSVANFALKKKELSLVVKQLCKENISLKALTLARWIT